MVHLDEFQSAPLMRGETQAREAKNIWRLYFNPLPSYEGRPRLREVPIYAFSFQSTPLTRGETLDRLGVPYWVQFQSTPLTRGETTWEITDADIGDNFNPLPSHEGRRSASFMQ